MVVLRLPHVEAFIVKVHVRFGTTTTSNAEKIHTHSFQCSVVPTFPPFGDRTALDDCRREHRQQFLLQLVLMLLILLVALLML